MTNYLFVVFPNAALPLFLRLWSSSEDYMVLQGETSETFGFLIGQLRNTGPSMRCPLASWPLTPKPWMSTCRPIITTTLVSTGVLAEIPGQVWVHKAIVVNDLLGQFQVLCYLLFDYKPFVFIMVLGLAVRVFPLMKLSLASCCIRADADCSAFPADCLSSIFEQCFVFIQHNQSLLMLRYDTSLTT